MPEALAQVITSLPAISGAPQPTSPASFVAYLFIAALSLVGIAVFVAFLIGAVRYFFSAGSPGAVSDAKDRMLHAFLGLAVFLFSVVFLYTINPDFLKLRNPGLVKIDLPTGPAGAPEGSCRFVSAQWAGSATPGAEVGLVVVTEDCDDTVPVAFRILETGTTFSRTVLRNEAFTTWVIPMGSAGTSYHFEATTGGEKIVSDALDVGKAPRGPEPFPEACPNTQTGSSPPTSCDAPCQNTIRLSGPAPTFTYTCGDAVRGAAAKFHISPALIVAVMRKECPSGDLGCTTSDGGCGLMGVDPRMLFDPVSEFKACQRLLGSGASDSDQACPIMVANPDIAIAVGACILEIDTRSADRFKSENNYPPGQIQYTAAAYDGGAEVNTPSCNCRNSGTDTLPSGCTRATSTACKNCFTTIPKWMCPFDSPSKDVCAPNTSYMATRAYAASIDSAFAFFASCPEWQTLEVSCPASPAPVVTDPFSINKTVFSVATDNAWTLTIAGSLPAQHVKVLVEKRDASCLYQPYITYDYPGTDSSGNWNVDGIFTSLEIGQWRETATVGTETLNSIFFIVNP